MEKYIARLKAIIQSIYPGYDTAIQADYCDQHRWIRAKLAGEDFNLYRKYKRGVGRCKNCGCYDTLDVGEVRNILRSKKCLKGV